MKNYAAWLLYLLIFAGLAACSPPTEPVTLTRPVIETDTAALPTPFPSPTPPPPATAEADLVEVTRVVVEQLEPTATPAPCTALPEGMRLTIRMAEEDRTIWLETEGLLPEDRLIYLLNGRSPNHSSDLELSLANPVGSSGTHQEKLYLGENDIINWTGQIIHKRGAICFEFTLPFTDPILLESTAVSQPAVTIATGETDIEPIVSAADITPGDWSPDGRFLTLIATNPDGGEALFIVPTNSP